MISYISNNSIYKYKNGTIIYGVKHFKKFCYTLAYNKNMKKIFITLSTLAIALTVSGCSKTSPTLKNCSIHRDDEFGGAYIDTSIANFNKLGFKYGDSLNLTFSNNVTYIDIGYYSGYYVPAGQELVVAYPGYDYVKFCINYGDDVYNMNHFDKDTKVTVTLNEAGKYLGIEETLSISYSDDPSTYESKEQFANFRAMNVGNLKENLLYRGASPIDNRRNRPAIVDDLLKDHNIQYDIDLADKATIGGGFTAVDNRREPILTATSFVIGDYFQQLLDNDKVIMLGMAAAYKNDDFAGKMKTMFEAILNNDGPYYIHCLEGKDRTGYVCMVVEALCGATYEELVDDYFITYHNYYGIEKGTDKYEVIKSIHIDEMIRYVFGFNKSTNLLTANYQSNVNAYLLSIGLTQDQIDAIQTKLSKAS